MKKSFIYIFLLMCCLTVSAHSQTNGAASRPNANEAYAKSDAKLNRTRALEALAWIKETIEERYYDKNYHGVDMDARFKLAEEKIKKLDSNGQIFYVIAAVILEFKDSHTTFIPPGRSTRVEYGFTMQMVGNKCYVTDVKKDSDAEKKGLKAGDVLLGIGPYEITRESLWMINYFIYRLSPQEKLKLFVAGTSGAHHEVTVDSRFETPQEQKAIAEKRAKEKPPEPYKCKKINDELIACRLESFSIDKKYINKMMAEIEPFKKLILDLRGNGGGYIRIMEYLTGHFFDREVKIGTQVTRSERAAVVAKPQKERSFKGELLILTDSRSGSASEVFSRVMQLEKRGKVVGDVSAGAVMASIRLGYGSGRGMISYRLAVYSLSVTVADLIMSDGNRLENVGVIPDYPFGPSGKAFAEKIDPVLAYAANLSGAKLTSEEAGNFEFIMKKPENGEEKDDEDDGKEEKNK
jgi:C-terminal processing protease CtpA/Prc